MLRVKNRKVMMKLSIKMLRASKKKNIVIISAIMLTCILFTSLFSIGSSMIRSSQESTMRQVGGRSMASLKYILPEDYEKIKSDSAVKNPSYRILIGEAINHELIKLRTEVNYGEDDCAKAMFSYPTHGTMPKDRLELATSTLVLDALSVPHQLGETVSLDMVVDGKNIKKDFTLCGYWEGDVVAVAQQCWLSRSFCDEVAKTPTVSYPETDRMKVAGYWMMDFDYSNTWDIKGKTSDLLERNGYSSLQQDVGINWAYAFSDVDTSAIVTILIMLFMILLAGYLIIYNVFYINVTSDIKKYGLLKTIGTTGRQLKRVVRLQAMILSFIGIPAGLILGTVMAKQIYPFILKNFNILNMDFSIDPLVYILSIAFTYLTVWISSRRPCNLAAKVSPVEAVRYTVKYSSKRQVKKSSSVSVIGMAIGNLKRTRKKVAIVVLSLSLSMILLNSIYTIVYSLDADKYVEQSIIGDFVVTDATTLNFSIIQRNYAGVNEQVRQDLNKIDGVQGVSNIYCKEIAFIHLNDKSYDKVKQFGEDYREFFAGEYEKQDFDRCLNERTLYTQIYGMDEWAFQKLDVKEGSLNWEKFSTGNYIIVYTYNTCLDEKDDSQAYFYHVSDEVVLELPDGTTKKYEVMAIADVPYVLTNRSFFNLGAKVVIPEQEYLKHTKETGAMYSILHVTKDRLDYVDGYLQKYTKVKNPDLTYVSKQTYLDEFEQFIRMFWIVGGALSAVLALIGILNFVNAIVTSLIVRRQELAMLEAVGMTGRQQKSMIMWEGIIYAITTVIFSISVGSFVGFGLVKAVAGQIWFFSYRFTITPIIICIPVLVILTCLVPYMAYRGICKFSVVERLKIAE